MRGDLGIPIHLLDDNQRQALVASLTRKKKLWDEDQAPESVCAARHEDCHLWVPRHYDEGLWGNVHHWDWVEGESHRFTVVAKPDPDRGQDTSIPAMVDYLQAHHGGILVAPTGVGKTQCGYAIGAAFGRKIGVPVYVGHMMDNWAAEAKRVLGLTDDQIGIVQGDRCDVGKPVTLFSIQTLLSRGEAPEALRRQIGFLVCDEVHKHGAARWREIVRMFPAKLRLGLSADPVRKDGLDDIVRWSFGGVGHRARRVRTELAQAPAIRMVAFARTYEENKYHKWKKLGGEWRMGRCDPGKYDTLLENDQARTKMVAEEIVKAAQKGRQILVLSARVDHLKELRLETIRGLDPTHPVVRVADNTPYPADHRFIQTASLEAGMTPEERKVVGGADVIFATFVMARDALNVPKLDTLFFATPPGEPLQPVGRLREKAEGIERRPLRVVDCYETGVGYSKGRATRRVEAYRSLGCEVLEVTRP